MLGFMNERSFGGKFCSCVIFLCFSSKAMVLSCVFFMFFNVFI